MVTIDEMKTGLTAIPGTINEYGLSRGMRRWTGLVYNRLMTDIDGRSIFEEDWDICIILDACRADELQRQSESFEWLDSVSGFPSIASCTWNWLPRTVDATPAEKLAETTYVSANPFSGELVDPDQFGKHDPVYDYAWDHDHGTVYPRPVTDRAIHHWRNNQPERLLVHYVQPHVPFLTANAEGLSRTNFTHDQQSVNDAWDRVTRGELSPDDAIAQYRETLKRVLEDVSLLLSAIDAENVVVTADHGEAFGEWGLYGHPPNIGLPCLTRVPWVETRAVRERQYSPNEYDTGADDTELAEQLNALGYV